MFAISFRMHVIAAKRCYVLYLFMGQICGACPFASFAISFVISEGAILMVSLQAFRAETMVERFTARMHVVLQPGRRRGQGDEQKIREKIHVLLHCFGSWQSFAISARQFVL